MKKGTFFSARKNQSLFDNNIKIKEMDNVELMLDSSAIPESGTAKVRSRPTVKHHTSSSDVVQGFNVPTPKVPVLPPFNRPKINRAVNGDRLSNGSAISVPDLVEGEIFIPPPPSMAPPPPPPIFIPPPPDFLGDLGDLDSIQHPSMPPPKPPSKPPTVAPSEEDKEVFTSMKPPPMPPPKPLSTSSSASSSSLSISTPPPTTFPDITEPPKFAPPQPPTDMRQAALKALKTPPTKPMRLSSIPIMYEPPQVPAPDPPIQTPTPSSFNPQNTAKLYSVPKTGILGRQVEGENRHKQILLLHDPGSTDSVPVQVNGTAPSVAPPAKPARRNSLGMQLEQDLQELKDNLQVTLQGQPTPPETWEEVKVEPLPLSAQQAINKPAETPAKASPKLQEAAIPPKMSPKLQKVVTAPVTTEASQVKHEASPGRSHKFSPMLDRKLRNLKASAVTGTREGPATSPLALLMAAKEREKHRSTLSRENSTKSNEPSVSIQHSESNPNSFTVIPSSTFTSVNSQHNPQSVVPVKPPVVIQTPAKPQIIESVLEKRPIANPVFQGLLAVEKQSGEQRIPSPTSLVRDVENREDLCMPLLPPPPEFNDHDDVMESPPSSPPPDPPLKKVLAPTPTPVLPVLPSNAGPIVPVKTPSPAPPPPPPPKPKPPSPPKLLPPVMEVKPKLPVQATPKSPPTQAPSSLSASQATLLSILQKKMLEMDHKMDNKMMAMKTDSDDWGSSLSEETKVPVVPRVNAKTPVITAKSKNAALSAKTQGLDMKELETKMAMNSQGLSAPSKVPISNGPQSKQAYGMTFMVRPGTKQPITVVSKGDSS